MRNLNEGSKLNQEIDRITSLMESTNIEVDESSLSRVWTTSEKFDIAIISASRSVNMNCVTQSDKPEGEEFTKEENFERTRQLQAVLLDKGYGIQKIKGSYLEHFQTAHQKEVQEASFFVVNRNQDEDFFNNIIKFGTYFCQDSVLLKPKGQDAYLMGTNNSDWPGRGNKEHLGKFKGGEPNEFMSRVGKSKRPFTFGEDFNTMSRGLISKTAKQVNEEILKKLPQ
jgi:hypothetical protein